MFLNNCCSYFIPHFWTISKYAVIVAAAGWSFDRLNWRSNHIRMHAEANTSWSHRVFTTDCGCRNPVEIPVRSSSIMRLYTKWRLLPKAPFIAQQLNSTQRRVASQYAINTSMTQLNSTPSWVELSCCAVWGVGDHHRRSPTIVGGSALLLSTYSDCI